MNVDDLFTKIGILTVENDMLRAQLNAAREELRRLAQEKSEEDTKATEESPQE